jgi:hypothetical protein
VLLRHEPDPGREVSSGSESLRINCDGCGRRAIERDPVEKYVGHDFDH